MIKVLFNPKQFPNARIGILEDYYNDSFVEFIMCDENYIEYDDYEQLMDFYANLDNLNYYFMDDLDELFNEKMGDDDSEYSIEERVGHFFLVKQI